MDELVRRTPELSKLDKPQVAKELAELADRGDIQTLGEVADQAAAYQAYEKRRHAKEQADYFGRVKVMAEANIGAWDIVTNLYARSSSLMLGDRQLERAERDKWRLLGTALKTGRLEEVLDRIERGEEGVTTHRACQEVRQEGFIYIDARPFRRRYLKKKKKEKLTQKKVAEEIGIIDNAGKYGAQHIHRYIGRNAIKIPHPFAIRLAEVLEVPEREIRAYQRPKRKRRRRLRKPRKLIGGRLDESYSLIRKALQELDRATGQTDEWHTMEAWEHLYAAEEIVGKALKRADAEPQNKKAADSRSS